MNHRWVVLGLLVLLSVITYLDRVCIAVAGPRMQAELGLSPRDWGWVLGVFSLAYGIFEIPTGALGDRLGHRRVITRIVLWWSAFTALTGLVSNYYLLLATRFLFGVGEAGAYPNMAGSVGRWFRPTERARAQGVIWGASRVGGALTPLLVVPLMVAFGWRSAFFVFAAAGVVWAVVWYAWYRDRPYPHPAGATDHAGVPWRGLFRGRQLWLIMATAWCYGWGSSFYLSWFHTYLVKGRGLTEEEMGFYAALPFVLGAFGNLGGGFLGDHLARRFGLRTGRRLVGSVSLAVGALLILTAVLTAGPVGVLALALAYGVMDCMLPSAWANCMDVGGRYAGAVSGAMNTAVQAGGFLGIVLFGYLVEEFGGYAAPLVVIACMVLLSAVLFSRIDPTRPLIPAPDPAPAEEVCA
jgi:MFS family permease